MTHQDKIEIYDLRNGPTGKSLTNSQYSEAWAITEIMRDSIQKTGRFAEKFGDYSHALSRTEKFGQVKGETIVRELFEERYGQTMNQMREELMEREAKSPEDAKEFALEEAWRIETMIRDGDTMPFYRAYDHAAHTVSDHLYITESGAKTLMKEAFREAQGSELYDAGKAWEKQYHAPKREAACEKPQAQTKAPARSMQP